VAGVARGGTGTRGEGFREMIASWARSNVGPMVKDRDILSRGFTNR
jgi:cell division protein FtsB